MKARKFYLKVVVLSYESADGRIITISENIMTEQDNYSTYTAENGEIFKKYEELMNDDIHNKYKINISFEPIAIIDEENMPYICQVCFLNSVIPYVNTIYKRVQYYGGAEEGGWYYHNLYLTDMDYDSMTEEEREEVLVTDRYGEGYVHYEEFYRGQNQKTKKEYYS